MCNVFTFWIRGENFEFYREKNIARFCKLSLFVGKTVKVIHCENEIHFALFLNRNVVLSIFFSFLSTFSDFIIILDNILMETGF